MRATDPQNTYRKRGVERLAIIQTGQEMTRPMSYFRQCGMVLLAAIFMISALSGAARAQDAYTMDEIIQSGHSFFGSTSGGLATAVEKIFSTYGLPNGYILGEEGGGAFVGGLTYGEGTLYTKNAGDYKMFWQGPSVGWDFGGQGSRVMILAYNLEQTDQVYGRFAGLSGSAYFLAGVGFNVLKRNDVLLVPVRTGVGARLGVNIGYLKLTAKPTWNPF
jgi:hypothetical protein